MQIFAMRYPLDAFDEIKVTVSVGIFTGSGNTNAILSQPWISIKLPNSPTVEHLRSLSRAR